LIWRLNNADDGGGRKVGKISPAGVQVAEAVAAALTQR